MAFVFSAPRKITEGQENQDYPSPAHYKIQQNHVSHQYAPFQSTSLRKIAFEEAVDKQIPGPGQYDIGGHIIQPKITSYVNNSSVIVRINSTGSPQFKSETKRFEQKPPEGPDLTKYQHINEYVNVTKRSKWKTPSQPLTHRTQLASIPQKSRGLLPVDLSELSHEKQQENGLGPGCYQSNRANHINSKGTVWAKDSSKRFSDPSTIDLGPGQYWAENLVKSKPHNEKSAIFKSGTVRTFFDSIMYNSSIEHIANQRAKKDFKSPTPAPGQYDIPISSMKKSDKKPIAMQFFGSKIERFAHKDQVQKQQKFYNVTEEIGSNRSFNYNNRPFNSQVQRDSSFLTIAQRQTPGPGEYYRQFNRQRRKKGKSVQQFGSTVERSPKKSQEEENLAKIDNGPTIESQMLKNRFGQLQKQSSIFRSKTNRDCFVPSKLQPKIGDYDVSYNDVAKKLQRQKVYIQNLRKIEVTKPPFQSNNPRFPHYQPWSQQQNNPENDMQKVKLETVTQQISWKSKGGNIGKQPRFKAQRRGGSGPSVGTYYSPPDWEKPTFNVRFMHL